MKVFMGKRPKERRADAVERMKAYTYKNSKSKRKGTRTEQQWSEWNKAEIERLGG
jgi:hypothetical protein